LGRDNELQKLGFSYGMSEAIKIALTTKNFPNPNVGAALISMHGELIATGFHNGKNSDHAEIDLLKNIKKNNIDTENTTLYITLEPCMHTDTSPSCAVEIVESKLFKNIIIGDIDPDIRTDGKGYKYLSDNILNVELQTGAMEYLDSAYMNYKKNLDTKDEHPTFKSHNQIEVIIKAGVSNNDYIYSSAQDGRYITSNESRKLSHYLRGTVDAIMVGKNTLIIDEPELNIRHGIKAVDPTVFVLWGTNESLYEEYLYKHRSFNFLVSFEHNNSRSHTVAPLDDASTISNYLTKVGIRSLLVEGGNSTWDTFFPIAQQVYIFESPHSIKSGKKISKYLSLDTNAHDTHRNLSKYHNLTKKIKLSEDTLFIYNNMCDN